MKTIWNKTVEGMQYFISLNADKVTLVKLEILDAFGQKSVMTFDSFESNPSGLQADSFKFSPPTGVEIIKP